MVRGAGQRTQRGKQSGRKKQVLSRDVFDQLQARIDKHGKTIQKIPLDMIQVSDNIRDRYDEEKLQQLARSLEQDGLIQFPTLCLREVDESGGQLVCRNGHRRILAAKRLGWAEIECIIISFESAKDELYHTLNANLSEDVFYLDLAAAYEEAHRLGESDQAIAERVGVNPRTAGWYRRLTQMSQACQNLCRDHPHLFNATWAIKMARLGDLPPSSQLEPMMHEMVKAGRTWLKPREDAPDSGSDETAGTLEQRRSAQAALKQMVSETRRVQAKPFAQKFLGELVTAGLLSESAFQKIRRELFAEQEQLDFVQKGLQRQRQRRPKQRANN
jgi:hypothetical protein